MSQEIPTTFEVEFCGNNYLLTYAEITKYHYYFERRMLEVDTEIMIARSIQESREQDD